jgi:hypothetical protein
LEEPPLLVKVQISKVQRFRVQRSEVKSFVGKLVTVLRRIFFADNTG